MHNILRTYKFKKYHQKKSIILFPVYNIYSEVIVRWYQVFLVDTNGKDMSKAYLEKDPNKP